MVKDESNNLENIEEVNYERYLGVIFDTNLKWTEQINKAVNKANRILGFLSRTFESREVDIWKQLYTSIVRPHLEYAILGGISKL